MTQEEEELKKKFKQKYWPRLLNNFKNPEFVIKIWQQMCILAFLSGVVVGAVFTQNYYINQVNEVFQQAREQNGCFNNFITEIYGVQAWENFSWEMKDVSSVLPDGVSDNTSKPE